PANPVRYGHAVQGAGRRLAAGRSQERRQMKDLPSAGNARGTGPEPDATVLGGPAGRQEFDILLNPVSHPDLGEIRIEDELFAIGRTEPPFASYPPAAVADLSRRHA